VLAHLDAEGPLHVAWVERTQTGVTVVDDWDGMGQRTTASGTVLLEGVQVDADRITPYHLTFESGPSGRWSSRCGRPRPCWPAPTEASVRVSSRLFEVAGTRAALDSLNLHRHWRNARTHTLHDPAAWKVQHLGRWALDRRLAPSHGQI
jgi:alkylation response protein AidB-like acyl-CoA dehydrogenase